MGSTVFAGRLGQFVADRARSRDCGARFPRTPLKAADAGSKATLRSAKKPAEPAEAPDALEEETGSPGKVRRRASRETPPTKRKQGEKEGLGSISHSAISRSSALLAKQAPSQASAQVMPEEPKEEEEEEQEEEKPDESSAPDPVKKAKTPKAKQDSKTPASKPKATIAKSDGGIGFFGSWRDLPQGSSPSDRVRAHELWLPGLSLVVQVHPGKDCREVWEGVDA